MTNTRLTTQKRHLWQHVIDSLVQFNVYRDTNTISTQDQIRLTRIYLCLLVLSFFVLLLFNGFTTQTQLMTIDHPDVNTFKQLSNSPHRNTLDCPCSQISISYDTFLTFQPQFHPVCSSTLVTMEWSSSLFRMQSVNDYHPLDFRLIASRQFQKLAFLCRISQKTIVDALTQLQSTDLVTDQTLFPWQFQTRVESIVTQFQRDTLADLSAIDRFVSQNINYNYLGSALRTNYFLRHRHIPETSANTSSNSYYPSSLFNQSNFNETLPGTFDGYCFCHLSQQCVTPSAIFSSSNRCNFDVRYWSCPKPIKFVPGMLTGCSSSYALYQSTLECFYNRTCFDMILSMTDGSVENISLWNDITQTSRFNEQSSIGETFADLFVESWGNSSDYNMYFDACAPTTCIYSYQSTFDLVSALTIIFGMIGGLAVALHFISPLILRAIIRMIIRRSVTCDIQSNVTNIQQRNDSNQEKLSEFCCFNQSIHIVLMHR